MSDVLSDCNAVRIIANNLICLALSMKQHHLLTETVPPSVHVLVSFNDAEGLLQYRITIKSRGSVRAFSTNLLQNSNSLLYKTLASVSRACRGSFRVGTADLGDGALEALVCIAGSRINVESDSLPREERYSHHYMYAELVARVCSPFLNSFFCFFPKSGTKSRGASVSTWFSGQSRVTLTEDNIDPAGEKEYGEDEEKVGERTNDDNKNKFKNYDDDDDNGDDEDDDNTSDGDGDGHTLEASMSLIPRSKQTQYVVGIGNISVITHY